ncbi:YjgN family protein [Deinococcus sp.]|uniref:YjgN family protein n=1 Tax=Deinococcus sp. TaxID=47478 RepID=UPI002869C96F|nr:YjgN family protein [Deinococcus sp.]
MTDLPAPLDPADDPSGSPYGRHEGLRPVQAAADVSTLTPATVTEYPVSFTGRADEYFRIWIVNVALTIVTLGIYLPWARVRTRQYFYGHTWVDGQNFEYRASPVALLRGYVIVGTLFVGYSLATQFQKYWIAAPLLLIYVGLYPWLVRQSLRFQAANTVHRGLRFGFVGTLRDSYVTYGAANILGSIGGIFALPWAWFMQRRYQLNHLEYGTARGNFRGDVAPFYVIAVTAVGVGIGLGIVLLVPLAAVLFSSFGANRNIFDTLDPTAAIVLFAVAYVGFIVVYTVLWQYARAAIMAYVLNNGELGGVVRTRATFRPWTLVWIGVTNAAATVFTLGLATPWAAIRRTKYVLEGIQVRAIAPLDDFAAGAVGQESALGEAATELLDIQVGF